MAVVFILASLLGILPIAIWLVFFLWQDIKKPEPAKWILIAFLTGILLTPFIWVIETFFSKLIFTNLNNESSFWMITFYYLIIAIIEELGKFLSATLILKKNKYFDEAIDAMIYLIVLALGFALVENILATSEDLITNNGLLVAFQTAALRFVGADLIHVLSSGLIGFFWALSLIKKKKKYLFIGLIFGIILHTSFNIAIIKLPDYLGFIALYFISFAIFWATAILLWVFDITKKLKKPIKYANLK
ncbi:MAG: PrsW family intramembrane metalloprotease [Minisyncoccia bacterium]